jgi:hypothetical protein
VKGWTTKKESQKHNNKKAKSKGILKEFQQCVFTAAGYAYRMPVTHY